MPVKKTPKLPRRRCANDNKLFNPKKPWAKFCSDACRKEYNRHGSAFGPMKTGLHKAIDKKYAELRKDFFREIKDQSRRIDRVEAMIEPLRLRLKWLSAGMRQEYECHTHEFYTDGSGGEIETGQPLEVRERQSEAFRAQRKAALSSALK